MKSFQHVFIILVVCFLKVALTDVVYLNHTNSEYDGPVISGFKSICKRPMRKAYDRIWKTTYFIVNGTNECSVYEAARIEDLENSKNLKSSAYLYYSQKLISRVSNLLKLRSNDEPACYQIVYAPTFKNYCIGIETTGRVNVKIHYYDYELKLFVFLILGFALFYFANSISRNDYFHYSTGISLGVIGSLLILFIIAFKYIPRKSTAVVALLSGGSVMAFTLRWVFHNFKALADSLQVYLIYYVVASALLSWGYFYYRGPIRSERALNLIEIVLKFLGLLFIYMGTSLKEVSILCMILIFSIKFMLKIMNSKIAADIGYKFFPPKRRLLTSEEYTREAHEYTAKALRELREYCKSPDCNSWKVLSRVKQPDRLAKFVEDFEPHVTENELNTYENYTINNDLIDEDDDDYYNEQQCSSNNTTSN